MHVFVLALQGAFDLGLSALLDTLGTVIHAYEETHHPMPTVKSGSILRYLMEEHDLKQADLPEIGSQGVVSEILRGKRSDQVQIPLPARTEKGQRRGEVVSVVVIQRSWSNGWITW